MTTVTAQYVYNFAIQPDENPWVETGYTDRSGVPRIVSGAYRRSSGSPITQYTGVSHNGVGAFVVKAELKASGAASDQVRILATDSTGNGYAASVDMINKLASVRTVANWVVNASGLGSGSTPTWVTGDILTLSVTPGTPNTIQIQYNGATISIGLTTHTMALSGPLYGSISIYNGNNGLASIGSWGVDGITAGGTVDLSTTLIPATGYQYVTTAGLPTGQPSWLSAFDSCSPAVENGDQWECPTITSAGATITQRPDGTLIVNDGDPDTEHSFTARLYDQTTLDWGSAFTITINAPPPPGSVINRDTTATPYRPSANGVTYFGYPNGNAPVVIATSYGQLRTMASTAATFGGGISVEAPYIRGFFEHSATDPNGNGDDGGLVIAAAGGGFWIRQFTYSKTTPIELDWYESVVNNFDVTALLKQIAQKRTPNFYVRVPSRPMKLVWNSAGTFDWTATHAIGKFRLYESTAPVEIYLTAATPADVAAWKMSVDDFLLGSPVKKASHLDYLLTFSSSWTFDNRFYNDSISWETPPPSLEVIMTAAYANDGVMRCNATKLQGYFIRVYGADNLTFKAAGFLRYGTGFSCSGPGLFDFESLHLADECNRRGGWTGTAAGIVDRNLSLARSGQMNGAVSSHTGNSRLRGDITVAFGSGFEIFFWDYLGTSIDDPLIVRVKSYGVSGPNEFGKPAGVHMTGYTVHNNHPAKSDGFGQVTRTELNKRFLKLIVDYDDYGEFTGHDQWTNLMFIENNSSDDVGPPFFLCYTQNVTYIIAGARGKIWEQNGPDYGGGPQIIEDILIMGDGVNPAWVERATSNVDLGKDHSLKYAKLHNMYAYLSGVVLDTVNSTGKLTIVAAADVTAANLTFSGVARNIIHFDDVAGSGSAALVITNLHAPVGSTITKDAGMTATCTINGVTKALPYTIQAGDLGTAVPDIPPNPLLGAVA